MPEHAKDAIPLHEFPSEPQPEWVPWMTLWLGAAIALDALFALSLSNFGTAAAVAEGIVWVTFGTVVLVALLSHGAALLLATYGLARWWTRRDHRLPLVRMSLSLAGVSIWILIAMRR